MAIKKLIFCCFLFTQAMNATEETFNKNEDFNDEKSSRAVVEGNVFINKNTWNTRKWGSIYLLFNPIFHLTALSPEYTWLTFFRIFAGDILYRYIAKKGVGVMLKFGFNSSLIFIGEKTLIRLSPSLTLSFCWVYKKKGNKMFSGSICPIGVGLGNKRPKKQIYLKKNYFLLFLNISYLHYENGKGFFLSWGKFDMVYSKHWYKSIVDNILLSLWHLELGFSLLKAKHRKKY